MTKKTMRMKKTILFGLLLMLMTACGKEEVANPSMASSHALKATLEEQDATRTYMGGDYKFYWHGGDRIKIYTAESEYAYYFTGSTGDRTGLFYMDEGASYGDDIYGRSVAVYPEYLIPNSHAVTADSFTADEKGVPIWLETYSNREGNGELLASETNAMVAVHNNIDEDLYFKNIQGYLMLQLYGEDVSVGSIEVADNNPYTAGLGGDYWLKIAEDGTPVVTPMTDEEGGKVYSSAQIYYEEPLQLGATADEATPILLALPPVTLADGFTLNVRTSDGSIFRFSTYKPVEIERNTILPMKALKVVPVEEHFIATKDDGEVAIPVEESVFSFDTYCYMHSEDFDFCQPVCQARVVGEVDWLTLLAEDGVHFTFKAEANPMMEPRSAVIYITESSGSSSYYTVTQSGGCNEQFSIVGTWHSSYSRYEECFGGEVNRGEYTPDESYYEILRFNADGTGQNEEVSTWGDETYTDIYDFNYTYSNGVLTIYEQDGDTYSSLIEDADEFGFAQYNFFCYKVDVLHNTVAEYGKLWDYYYKVEE